MDGIKIIPFKSTAYGRATLGGYAGPGSIYLMSYFSFPVSRFPLKNHNGERETGNGKRNRNEYKLRPVLRGRPKPRLLDVVGYFVCDDFIWRDRRYWGIAEVEL